MKIKKEYCVCKKCGFGYANIKNHLCLTSLPPKYVATYHCPVCRNDGQISESEVFIREEESNANDGFTSDFVIGEPIPMPMQNSDDCNDSMPQKLVDDNGKEITLNGDTGKGETVRIDTPLNDTNIIKVPELSEEDKEKILKYIKENKNYIIKSLECSIEPLIDIKDLIKCIKLIRFCGVNDLGALKDGLITKEEYDFIQQIFSKIEVE